MIDAEVSWVGLGDRVATSEGAEFDALCMRSYPHVVRAVTLYCGDQAVAEEAAQEARDQIVLGRAEHRRA